ncbi:hypothetical protein ACSBR1_014541 [Camellia fascicularis]
MINASLISLLLGMHIEAPSQDQQFMLKNFTISMKNFKSGRVHTMIKSTFSHIDIGHFVSNMIGLYFFGVNVCIHAS